MLVPALRYTVCLLSSGFDAWERSHTIVADVRLFWALKQTFQMMPGLAGYFNQTGNCSFNSKTNAGVQCGLRLTVPWLLIHWGLRKFGPHPLFGLWRLLVKNTWLICTFRRIHLSIRLLAPHESYCSPKTFTDHLESLRNHCLTNSRTSMTNRGSIWLNISCKVCCGDFQGTSAAAMKTCRWCVGVGPKLGCVHSYDTSNNLRASLSPWIHLRMLGHRQVVGLSVRFELVRHKAQGYRLEVWICVALKCTHPLHQSFALLRSWPKLPTYVLVSNDSHILEENLILVLKVTFNPALP